MFQYEIHNLKSGKVVYRHIFVDKDYQITITRAAITREQLRIGYCRRWGLLAQQPTRSTKVQCSAIAH